MVSGTDAEPEYLDDPAFAEPHRGPKVPGGTGYAHLERDPSPAQIRRMCRAILRHKPRHPTGHDPHWHLPTIPRPDPSDGGLASDD